MTTPRIEQEIVAELEAVRQEYHEKAQTEPPPVTRELSIRIRELQAKLSDYITSGANPCPTCGELPHGIHQPTRYEVGCLNCRNTRAIGITRKNAVDNWNEGELYVKE